ncbi:MAG: prepilin-type N-terminal cleavage/methylation domain-containing protein [Opitutales bacterium]|nr:prepilin-type N-terminal cleavage/methylation domain-containing protein [Opitutales bacterium]
MKYQSKKGFTLVEIMIVVVITRWPEKLMEMIQALGLILMVLLLGLSLVVP